MFCVTKDGRAWEGTKADILSDLCDIRFVGETRQLVYRFPGFQEVKAHGYYHGLSDFEIAIIAINDVWELLPAYGFRVYKSI